MEITTPFLNFRERFAERWMKPVSADEYARWRDELERERESLRERFAKNEYEREDLAWYRDSAVEHFTFLYDLSVYEPGRGYKIDEFLDYGETEFGGYDILLLWQAYPRIGCDDRNQFDFYREMPGGLPGLREVVDRCHERGVRAFIDYNPWDTSTRREEKSDYDALAEIVAAIDADGIFLDTMSASSEELRAAIDAVRPGVVFETEGSPSFEAAECVTGSWGSFNPIFGQKFLWHREFPFVANTHLTMRWLEPRHSTRIVERHSHHRTDELLPAFFNGAGAVIWENVFGWWNPWSPEDRAVMRKISSILRNHHGAFQSPAWQPLILTRDPYVMANEWPADDETVWTVINLRFETTAGEIFELPSQEGARYYDAWNDYREIEVRSEGGQTYVPVTIGPRSAGCIVRTEGEASYKSRRSGGGGFPTSGLDENRALPVVPTEPHSGAAPEEMVEIPAGEFEMCIEHRPREGACYDDVSYCWANTHPVRSLSMERFLMDRFPVTNREFKTFLEATGYEPDEPTSFLKHWTENENIAGRMVSAGREFPVGKENHPVVYVDLTDARAYARWAGKRLPTEEEWQYAAQGTDGRIWPWGNGSLGSEGTMKANDRCNTDTADTTPVDSFPGGASPFGVWDMAGNVWEWTESERNDGHSRYVMLKGGSFYEAKGSRWYFDGGAQRCTTHGKFLLMWPGLDRCSTIGFRCAKDMEKMP